MKNIGQHKTAVWLLAVLLLVATASGCTVKFASDYDEVFDKQLASFQKQYNDFLIKVAVDRLKYCDAASTEFYDGVVLKNMRFLVTRAYVQGMHTAKTPLPKLITQKCKPTPKAPAKPGDDQDKTLKLCPLRVTTKKDKSGKPKGILTPDYKAEFAEIWKRRQDMVFGPYDLEVLACRCNQSFSQALGDALDDVSLVTLCQLHLLWKSLYRLALDHAVASANGKTLHSRQLAVHSRQVGSFFQNLMFLEKEKKAARSIGKDK